MGGTGANTAAGARSALGAVALAGDTMTGQLNISSGGLLVTGNVGFGTSSPISKLDIFYTSGRRLISNYDDSLITIKASNDGNNPEALRLIGDRIQFSTGTTGSGTEKMRIDANGNIGVNTTNPATRLDVRANTNDIFQIESASHSTLTGLSVAAAFSRGNDGSGKLGAIFGWNNGGLAIAARGGIVFATGGSSTYSATSRVVDITDGGNVGIGTSVVSGRLHIGTATPSDNNALVFNRGVKPPSITSSQSAILCEWNAIGGSEAMTFMGDAYKFLDETGNTEFLRISSVGNIGIGTVPVSTSLTGALTIYKLHGADTVGNVPSVTGQTYSNNQSNLYLFGRNAGITVVSKFSEGGHLLFADDDSIRRGGVEYGHTTDTMTLLTAGSERITILSGGNVGIATTNPGTKLHVNDSVAAYWTGSSFTGGNPSIATITNSYPGGYDAALRFQMTGQSGINGQQRDVGYIGFVGTASWAADASADASMYVLTRNPSSNTVVERMRIDSGGRITTPGQPSFMARRTTGFTISVATVITYDSELGDRGGYYNASNGRFTAPVTGYYMFKAHLQPTTSGVSVNINFWVNGSATTYASVGTTSLSARGDIENVIVLPLNTNDYVEVVCSVSSSCGFDNHGIFCGFLIG